MSSPTKKLLCVQINEAPPSKISEAEREAVRFLSYNQPVQCAMCGKSRLKLKTMLCGFIAIDVKRGARSGNGRGEAYNPKKEGKQFPPLTPVCEDHQLSPDWQ